MKILCFGSYDPNFSRSRVLVKGLRKNGVEVIECNIFSSSSRKRQRQYSRNTVSSIITKYLRLMKKRMSLSTKNFDAVLVQNHEGVPLAHFVFTEPVIFDTYLSLYEAEVEDRKRIQEGSWKALLLYYSDKYSFNLADICTLDTFQHIDYICKRFELKRAKFRRIFVGTDDDVFYPRPRTENAGVFRVMFWGSFIPLQGIQYIVHAANLLRKERDIAFEIFGSGQTYFEIRRLAEELKLKNVSFHPDWIPYEELPNQIAKSDVCLGIFGSTSKAKRVVPNKVYETLAMKKPLITGDSAAAKECFLKNEENCLLCEMGNPKAIADAVLQLKEDKKLRERVAAKGYELFKARFAPDKIGRKLKRVVSEALFQKP